LANLPEDESVAYPEDKGIRGKSVHTVEEAMIGVLDSRFDRAGAGLNWYST